jgi:hypothetical protein
MLFHRRGGCTQPHSQRLASLNMCVLQTGQQLSCNDCIELAQLCLQQGTLMHAAFASDMLPAGCVPHVMWGVENVGWGVVVAWVCESAVKLHGCRCEGHVCESADRVSHGCLVGQFSSCDL